MSKPIAVVKYGTSSIVTGGVIDKSKLEAYAQKVAKLSAEFSVILVTSGSIALAREELTARGRPIEDEQILAMIGSAGLVVAWQQVFADLDMVAGQLLVTHREIADTTEHQSLKVALTNSMQLGVITVVNENDALSVKELAKLAYGGDNDGLASHIAKLMQADVVLLLTDSYGLLDASSSLVRKVANNDKQHDQVKSWAGPYNERGQGMLSKVEAAIDAAKNGIDAYIAGSGADYKDVMSGKTGTHFLAA